jgi:hypothetical protein
VWRKLTLSDAHTTGENLDESIFTRVTKCHKKHAFTRSRPRSHSRRRASDFTRALARAASAPPPTAALAIPSVSRQLDIELNVGMVDCITNDIKFVL